MVTGVVVDGEIISVKKLNNIFLYLLYYSGGSRRGKKAMCCVRAVLLFKIK